MPRSMPWLCSPMAMPLLAVRITQPSSGVVHQKAPLQVELIREADALSFVCTDLGGEEIGTLTEVDPELTIKLLCERIEEEMPPAPGHTWGYILGGDLVHASRLGMTITEYFQT